MNKTKVLAVLLASVFAVLLWAGCAGAEGRFYERLYFVKPDGTKVFVFTTPGKMGLDLLLEQIFKGLPLPGQIPGSSGAGGIPGPGQPGPGTQPMPQPADPVPPPAEVPPSGQAHTLTPDETEMVRLVNEERTNRGLRPLTVDYRLVDLARKKSQDMIDRNYFGHISPTYGSPFDMMNAAGISYRIAGENLAGAPNVASAHKALMNSEGHRRNILNPSYTRIGVGAVKGGPYGIMFTQMFIGE